MTLIEALPKNTDGRIVLNPGGSCNEQELPGEADVSWFQAAFLALAGATVPLSAADLAALKAIDPFWAANANRWRVAGII